MSASDPTPTPTPSTPADPRPMIRLDDFMKAAGMVGTGGEAKVRIQGGEVIVNDEVETRRRRQLHSGDEVNWNSELWIVELTDDEDDADEDDDDEDNDDKDDDEHGGDHAKAGHEPNAS